MKPQSGLLFDECFFNVLEDFAKRSFGSALNEEAFPKKKLSIISDIGSANYR
jgi:hypothetical protein